MSSVNASIAAHDVIIVHVNDDMGSVAKTLADHHLKKAPVMDGSKMVGVINRSNITKYAVRRWMEDPLVA